VGDSEWTGQDAASAAQNTIFFDGNADYAASIAKLETYRHIREAVSAAIGRPQRLLDIGNGGVFDYDVALAGEVVAVDLFLETPPAGAPDHVTFRRGDALALDEPDAAYDCVVEVSVFHHLVGTDAPSTLENIRKAVSEAHRVLSVGGRFVVMESCVSPGAFAIERRLFGALRLVAGTRVLRHPPVLQFPSETIRAVIQEQFNEVRVHPIPVGRWIVQLGIRWPTALTPARPYLFVATKH
jgi:SAM-dependent methyltransferase